MSRKKPSGRSSPTPASAVSSTTSSNSDSPPPTPSTLKKIVEGHELPVLVGVVITTAIITTGTVGYLLQAAHKIEVSRLEYEREKTAQQWEDVKNTLLTADRAFDVEKIRIDENEVPRYLRDGFQPLPEMEGVLVLKQANSKRHLFGRA